MNGFWKSFGPGLLWAAAAIGVSHLVQATRAGAMAGFSLWWVLLLALVLKYPFFEFGPRYAAATGESLVEGYLRIGRWAVWLYLLMTLAVALNVMTAVVYFTALIIQLSFGLDWSLQLISFLVLALSITLLAVGRYKLLDRSIKVILVLLAISTLIAAGVSIPRIDPESFIPWPAGGSGTVAFPFLLALIGWMPSGFNITVWSSLWTLAKDRDSGVRASVSHALLDFRIGYLGASLLAFAFVALGAGVMHGSGEQFSSQGPAFSVQLIDMYVQALGNWTRPVVLLAVLTTMFSTALTVIDGFPRALARSVRVLTEDPEADSAISPALVSAGERRAYWIALGGLSILVSLVITFLIGTLTALVDFATTVSFLLAPVLGYLNLRAVRSPQVAPEHRPGPVMTAVSYAGLALLAVTTLIFLVSRLT